MENKFISIVAKHIWDNCNDAKNIEVIVPNNRIKAAIISEYRQIAKGIAWVPKITPIKDIFYSKNDIIPAENIVLIYYLHKTFIEELYNEKENAPKFDEFYNFGETLLGDFDDIDKYLINPHKIFENVFEINEIDSLFPQNEEIIEVLKKFWTNINIQSLNEKKEATLKLWEAMPRIYDEFYKILEDKKIGYQGYIYRKFIEKQLPFYKFENQKYLFVGFSALNKCEECLIDKILEVKGKNNCIFFWDVDKYYIENSEQEAGLFLRKNIRKYGNYESAITNTLKDLKNKDVKIIEVPSPIAQVKLIPEILNEFKETNKNTAIILGDEKLLIPLTFSIPENIEYNVSMGYPLSYTASASFVLSLMKLAMYRTKTKDGKIYLQRKYVLYIIQHNFSKKIVDSDIAKKIIKEINSSKIEYINLDRFKELAEKDEFLQHIFDIDIDSTNNGSKSFPEYILTNCDYVYKLLLSDVDNFKLEIEFMHCIISLFRAFVNSTASDNIRFEKDNLYYKIMLSMIKQEKLAFEGKSDSNMQVLGFMETRSLDFDNIILLSISEGTFPKSSPKDSMIPYNLRKAFGLPSIEFQDSIYAYYFYRLLQRSKKIRILYPSHTRPTQSEKSRFITQIEYELGLHEDNKNSDSQYHSLKNYKIDIPQTPKISIKKTEKMMTELFDSLETKGIYPHALNAYISCPLQFYFRYVEKLQEPDSINNNTSSLDFGNLLHITCFNLYKDYIGKIINKSDFVNIKNNIESAIKNAVIQTFKLENKAEIEIGKALQNVMITPLRNYINKIIDFDENYTPFTILDLENEKVGKSDYEMEMYSNGHKIFVKGKIDRIDLKDGTIRVSDYKTSMIDDSKRKYTENFWEKFQNKEAAQVLLYCVVYDSCYNENKYKVCPSIISVADTTKYNLIQGSYGQKRNIESINDDTDNKSTIKESVLTNVKNKIDEILNIDIDFTQTDKIDECNYCIYKQLCGKEKKQQ